ncbi:MAG TPA: hypothetical protein VFV10_13310 [Gammaproteobacteria bacterium]|nr:hypothetical protein [Gammaproteobacteria bacterium]
MRAVVWHGKRDVRVDNVPDPERFVLLADVLPTAYKAVEKKDGAVKVLLYN